MFPSEVENTCLSGGAEAGTFYFVAFAGIAEVAKFILYLAAFVLLIGIIAVTAISRSTCNFILRFITGHRGWYAGLFKNRLLKKKNGRLNWFSNFYENKNN